MKDAQPIELVGKNGAYVFDPRHILSLNGRFSSVFRGTEIGTENRVIIKFLNPQRGSRTAEFRFKLEGLYNFGRPDIQDSIDYIVNDSGHFLVKKFIPGNTLKKIKVSRISLEEWKAGLLSLLDTIAFLHEKGIVHGDIKPANIIWPKSDAKKELPKMPVLIDFGLARLNGIQYNDAIYSFIYSPPEQQLGFGNLMGVHSDLFSLGITLYECITDLSPYDFDSNLPMIVEQAQLAYPIENRHELPKDWYAFLSYLCQKPQFRKPHTMYSLEEQEDLIMASIERRPHNVAKVKEMAENLSIKSKSNFWKFFG